MKLQKTTAFLLTAAIAATACTACTNHIEQRPSAAATADEAPTTAEGSITAENVAYYVFDMQLSARDGKYVYHCDDIFENTIEKYEINGSSSSVPFLACRVCVDGDTIYYVQSSENESGEKLWGLYSYSKSSEETTYYFDARERTNYLLRRNGLIYYQEGSRLNAYDISTHKKDEVLNDHMVSSYAVGDKIYYLSNEQVDTDYPGNGILKYYDLDSKASGVLQNESIKARNVVKTASGVFFWTTDKEKRPQSAQIFRVDQEHNTVDFVKTLQTDGELYLISCYDNTFVYQEFDNTTGDFSTSALSLTDGTVQTDKNANLQLIAMNSHSVGNIAACVLKDDASHKDYYFDTQSGKLKKVVNAADDRYARYFYCDGEICMYEALYDDSERCAAETLRLSDKLPSKQEALNSGISSSSDGEYVHTKKYVPNTCGYISTVPELMIDSEDVRAVNAEMEKNAYYSEYQQYYRYLVADHYLTIFTCSSYTGGRDYKIYTFDLLTGKRLSPDNIIALYTDDTDAFWAALQREFKNQQEITYRCGRSQMEADLEDREMNDFGRQLSEEEIEKFAAIKKPGDFQLGYYGDGELICSTSFKNIAGAEIKTHIFMFKWEE